MPELASTGEVVERQRYLNGTQYYLIEGEATLAGEAWSWTLSITLPKEQGAKLTEGDLALIAGDRSWFADVAGGSHREVLDDAIDTAVVAIDLYLDRRDGSQSTEGWRDGIARCSIRADMCEVELNLRP